MSALASVKQAPASPPLPPRASAPSPSEPRILIIDDTRAIHEDFRKILLRTNKQALAEAASALFGTPTSPRREVRFALDSAYQGNEGLVLVQQALTEGWPYSVAFVDVRMPPGWDGVETISRIWEVDPDLQVVICTAHSDYSWEDLTQQLGESDSLVILKKPFDNIEVLQLADALTKKWFLARQLKQRLADLDEQVQKRTQQLSIFNEKLLQDVAERQRAESRILRLNRLYSVLSKINEIIVRARSLEPLVQEACRILVEDGLFRMAWFGKVVPDTLAVQPIAFSGHEAGYLSEVRISAADVPEGQGPVGVSLREQRVTVCNDIDADPAMAPWRSVAMSRGYRSLGAFPVSARGRVIGALAVYNSEANYFSQEELQLFHQLSADLSFAVDFLEQSQQLRLQGAALESAANSIVITDHAGTVLWHNAAFTQLTGYTEQETVGRKTSVLKSGHHSREFYNELWRTISAGQVWHGELVNKRKDGRLYPEEMTITPVRGVDGNISHYVAIKQDITERKQAELRLSAFARLGQRLSSAQSAKAAAQIIVQVADQLVGWDACICDLYSEKEELVQPVLAMDIVAGQRTECNPDPPHPLAGLARRALRDGGQLVHRDLQEQEQPDCRPFGDVTRRSASILYVPIRNGTNVIGLLSIQSYAPNAYDQRKLDTLQVLADHCGGALDRIQTEEALRRAQERLNHLLSKTAAMIYTLKLNGQSMTFSWVSENVTDLLGFSPAEACQASWWADHVHPDDRPKLVVGETQLLSTNHRVTEFRFRHKDGGYRWLRDDQRLVREANGQPAEVVGTWLDVTERKELEQQLRQSQKMEAIGQLAGGVAHDFNNMLTVIRGHTELLLMEPRQLGGQAEDCLKQVVAAADRAANLTRQLLAFSRKQLLQSRPVDLDDVIGNLTKMLKRIIGEDIQFQCSHGAGLPMVQADVGMLEQVLINLVVNARDAMPHGGHLHIRTEKATIPQAYVRRHPEARPGEFACLTVSDTGSGIAAEHLPRIFEPFFTTKEVGRGTGLGLATVYGIVKQHQGWVEVASQVNVGSTFRVYLPAIDAPRSTADEPEVDANPPRGTETILLVEDDAAVRSLTRRLLESFGYQVREASTGREAFERYKNELAGIDLLLTDLVMPGGVNGRELAERLRLLRPGIKVILLSGYSGEALGADTDVVERIGARFLQKPCPWRKLLSEVRQCLDE